MDALQSIYDEIEQIINSEAGEQGHNFAIGKFSGMGWLNFYYTCSTYDGLYPRIALKRQTNAVHLYVMLWGDGKPILERYTGIFGKTAVGKSCLRIRKLDDKRKTAIAEIVRLAVAENRTKK